MATELLQHTPAKLNFDQIHHAPNAGDIGLAIQRFGIAGINAARADVTSPMTVPKALKLMNSFVEVTGVRAGGSGNAASISEAMMWPDHVSRAVMARVVEGEIAGVEAEIREYDDKILFILRTNYSPREMLERLVNAPRTVNKNRDLYSEEVGSVLDKIQDLREQELLKGQKGKRFEDIIEGRIKPEGQPIEMDGSTSILIPWERKGGGFEASNPEGKKQRMSELGFDDDTKKMLEDKEGFLLEDSVDPERFTYRYAILGAFDKWVIPCCITATTTQFEGDFKYDFVKPWDKIDTISDATPFVYGDNIGAIYNDGKNYEVYHRNDYCNKCSVRKNNEDGCKCAKD